MNPLLGANVTMAASQLCTPATMPTTGWPLTLAPERREEFAPGLDKELLTLIQATAEVEIASNGQQPTKRSRAGRRR